MKNTNRKILFIGPLPPPTTGQSVACELFLNFLKINNDVNLVNLSKQTFRQGISSFARIKEVLSVVLQVWRKQASVSVIYFTISESNAGNLKDLLIYVACWRRLNKMLIHLHGGAGMTEIMSSKHPLLRTMNTFFLRRLGGVIVLGDRLKSIYEEVVFPSKLHALPNFALDEFFVTQEYIEAKFSQVEPLRLLFLSNLLPGKGHQELLTALGQLPRDLSAQLHIDFAGGYESYDDEARFRLEVENTKNVQITVHGVVYGEIKRELLRKAHLFCLPTYYPYEGQPISILEAYSSGCSVMTTDHSGIFDTFTPSVNGVEVKPRSPASIVHAIQYALTHTQELHAQAKTNLQHAQDKYRPAIHVEALEKILSTIQ